MSYTIYTWHKGLAEERFDSGMTAWLQHELSLLKNCQVNVIIESGTDATYENESQSVKIPHGSVCIIQNDETLKFHVSDFGDNCADIYPFVHMKNFALATIGQFNRYKLQIDLPPHLYELVKPGYYPETNWEFGNQYYSTIQEYRTRVSLDNRLHFRGSVYSGLRDSIHNLNTMYSSSMYMGIGRLSFTDYIEELARFKMTLSMGMSPYHSDLCFRDIEMFGIGIPVIRPKLHVELADPLIPDVHYIACEVELNPYTLWPTNHVSAAQAIYEKYASTIDNDEFLEYISTNARDWYLRNMADNMPAKKLASWITI